MMTLIDKIQQADSNKLSDYSRIEYPTAKVIEKIADDYAIEFAEWMSDNCTEIQKTGNHKGKYFLLQKGDFFTSKQLLKIFKKEKGYE